MGVVINDEDVELVPFGLWCGTHSALPFQLPIGFLQLPPFLAIAPGDSRLRLAMDMPENAPVVKAAGNANR
ncbi:MAG: hypothetical protein DHS20C16_27400 [Phycisphaerae bacterium]|nr:MAG: hypothetical protein DHS20C16_27400 [Phycisphaerae bacterium]